MNTKIYLGLGAYALSIITFISGAFFKIMHWPGANHILLIGVGFAILSVIVSFFLVLTEMLKYKIHNKAVWIICLFLSPVVTAILFFVNKDKVIEA